MQQGEPRRVSAEQQLRLAARYSGLNESELGRLARDARSLTDDAKTALRQEIARRQLPIVLEEGVPGRTSSQQRGRPREKGGWVWALLLIALLFSSSPWLDELWTNYASQRTATVREVFLHGPSPGGGPKVFMDDGTVWELGDSAEHVAMLQGDEIRYVNKEHNDATSQDTCDLYDTTTGYRVLAFRISAPFAHTSCPAH